jgi:hypothetical protein
MLALVVTPSPTGHVVTASHVIAASLAGDAVHNPRLFVHALGHTRHTAGLRPQRHHRRLSQAAMERDQMASWQQGGAQVGRPYPIIATTQ